MTASYQVGNFNLNVGFNTNYSFAETLGEGVTRWTDPTITVSGSWCSSSQALSDEDIARLKLQYTDSDGNLDNTRYQQMLRSLSNNTLNKEILELERLESDMRAAERAFYQELEDYTYKSKQLDETIRQFKNEVELLQIKIEGNKKVRDQISDLYYRGEAEYEDLVEADQQIARDEVEWLTSKLRAHILSNKIKLLTM